MLLFPNGGVCLLLKMGLIFLQTFALVREHQRGCSVELMLRCHEMSVKPSPIHSEITYSAALPVNPCVILDRRILFAFI